MTTDPTPADLFAQLDAALEASDANAAHPNADYYTSDALERLANKGEK